MSQCRWQLPHLKCPTQATPSIDERELGPDVRIYPSDSDSPLPQWLVGWLVISYFFFKPYVRVKTTSLGAMVLYLSLS